MDMELFGIWVAALLTFMIFSFLYKDNPFYKFAEHLYLGVSVGYFICVTWFDILTPQLVVPLTEDQNYWLIIPMILGILMLARFIRQIAWISRWSMAFYVGFGAGIAVPSVLLANIMRQLETSMVTVFQPEGAFKIIDWGPSLIGQLIVVVGVLCVLTYFYFSIEHKGVVGSIGRVGIYFLMISFGAAFGYTVMARISLLIGRVQFLKGEWLPTFTNWGG